MEALNDDGQWIVMMGFLVAIGMFMLAVVVSQAPLVGQTTAESVMEFPKNEVQDLRGKLVSMGSNSPTSTLQERFREDMALLSMSRNNAIATYSIDGGNMTAAGTYEDIFYTYHEIDIHYNNGVTEYDEALLLPERRP
ncbi:hypothetical protein L1S32_11515 [Methanogenium sp. S4BF]|uniref:hypothetical protein n=1 Tax=Methanogenium sp. S4BF TaxID=1789226 RepID=UPI0024163DE4|nr:hypothetical protein [Methanogenium sp. S4BF]WFN34450.1 hypothetical protein L1S32_11515 [Methanogenium sp. S4BF]